MKQLYRDIHDLARDEAVNLAVNDKDEQPVEMSDLLYYIVGFSCAKRPAQLDH